MRMHALISQRMMVGDGRPFLGVDSTEEDGHLSAKLGRQALRPRDGVRQRGSTPSTGRIDALYRVGQPLGLRLDEVAQAAAQRPLPPAHLKARLGRLPAELEA